MTDPQATWSEPPDSGEPTWQEPPSIGSSGLGPAAERTLSRGTRVGAWEIRGELARGSMGVVYRARQADLPEREVALKLISAAPDDQEALERFQREGEALARLDHPHVVRVHAAGVLDDGRPYLAMELVRGKNLRQVAYEAGSLPVPEALRLLEPIARAVAHMHERGVLHRDLKLANVLLAPDGRPQVTDFGLAQLTDRRTRLTRTHDLIGTPLYMAPEVIRDGRADARADVYALGVMLFRLVVGRFPYYADAPLALFKLIQRSPLELPPDLPVDLAAVLGCALSKHPEDRYPDAASLADDLAALAADRPVSVVPVSARTRLRRWAGARRTPLVGAAFLLGLAVITAGGFGLARLRWDRAAARALEQEAAEAAARVRAEALAQVDREGVVATAAAVVRLGRLLDDAPAPVGPLDDADRRFLTAQAWLCLERGDAARARALLDRAAEGASDAANLTAVEHLRRALSPAPPNERPSLPDGDPARFERLDRLRANRPADPAARAPALVEEGRLLLALRWPASAAHAFEAAIATFPSWSATLTPVRFRVRPSDPERSLPVGLAAVCGAARARALLLDPEAAATARERARARAELRGAKDLARELAALAKGPLPAPAPAYLPQGEAELEAWRCERRWRLLQRQPLDSVRPRLVRAAQAFRLALRQGEAPARAWAGLTEVAIELGDLPEARRCGREAASRGGDDWRVEAARGRLSIATGKYAAGAAGLLLAAKRLEGAPLTPIPLAAERYALLRDGLIALQRRQAPLEVRLPLIERLATLAREVPLTTELRFDWSGKLQGAATRTGDEARAQAGRAGGRRTTAEYKTIRELYDRAQELSKKTHSLENPEGERVSLALERLDPTAAGPYLMHALNFLRSDPRGIDPLVTAFLLEPARTLYELTINLYQPGSRTLWGVAQRDKLLGWLRSGQRTRGLPFPADPELKAGLVSMHCLFMRTPLAFPDRSRALREAERFRARHPRSRAGALLLGLIRLELGDDAGALIELERAEQLHPLFPEGRWRQNSRLIRFHQARAHASLGRFAHAHALARQAVKDGVTQQYLIEEERRFREVADQPTSLREPFRRLLQLQREVKAGRNASKARKRGG